MQAESLQRRGYERQLEFTGNWFIDAGILGFVNLMEQVYGKTLDLREVDAIEGKFLYAFWYKIINKTVEGWLRKDNFKTKELEKSGRNIKEIRENVNSSIMEKMSIENSKIIQNVNFSDIDAIKRSILKINSVSKKNIREAFLPYEEFLNKKYSNGKKTIIENLDNIGFIAYSDFFRNLFIFNPSKNRKGKEVEILELFLNLLRNYSVRSDGSDVFDKSLNVFLFTASDFHNIYFGMPQTLKNLENIYGVRITYLLLSIPWSFIWIQKNHFFHTNSFANSYDIYRRLQVYKENRRNSDALFSVTWNVIIDTLFENKANFFLENLQIIEYSSIEKQQIQHVEYLSINKLNAALLLDDIIRANLNKRLPCDARRGNAEVWLIKELLDCNTLFPIALEHITRFTKERKPRKKGTSKPISLYLSPSLYALMIDANKQKLSANKTHFNPDFFAGYSNLVDNIKRDASFASYAFNALEECVKDGDEQDIYELLAAIKGGDRNYYLYVLYHMLLQCKDDVNRSIVSEYIFKNIIRNEDNWRQYALALLLKVVRTWKTTN